MIYGYHSKVDSKQEILGRGRFDDIEDAVITFAERKHLTIDLFLEMYEVTWLANYL